MTKACKMSLAKGWRDFGTRTEELASGRFWGENVRT